MPQGNPFSTSSSRYTLGSNAITDQSQGGGDKKSGFPYQIGRGYWSSIFFGSCDPVNGRCCTLAEVNKTMVFTKNTIRPISGDSRIPMR